MDERTATVAERTSAPERAERPPRRAAPPPRKQRRKPGSAVMDPVADLLTRVRNGARARKDAVSMPAGRLKVEIAKLLKTEGFIAGYDLDRGTLTIRLKYLEGRVPALTDLQRVSRSGRRVYAGRAELPRVRAGLGVIVVSTSRGLMTGKEAARKGLGGEVLCAAW